MGNNNDEERMGKVVENLTMPIDTEIEQDVADELKTVLAVNLNLIDKIEDPKILKYGFKKAASKLAISNGLNQLTVEHVRDVETENNSLKEKIKQLETKASSFCIDRKQREEMEKVATLNEERVTRNSMLTHRSYSDTIRSIIAGMKRRKQSNTTISKSTHSPKQ